MTLSDTERKTVSVTVKTGMGLIAPGPLHKAIAYLTELAALVPEDHEAMLSVYRNGRWNLYYTREETDEEAADRMNREREQADYKERCAALKAKYER